MVRTCLVRELVEELRARDAALPHVVVVDLYWGPYDADTGV